MRKGILSIALTVWILAAGAAFGAAVGEGGRVVFPVVLTDTATDRFFETTLLLMNLSGTTSTVEVAVFSNRLPEAVIDDAGGPVPVKVIALEPREAIRVPFWRPISPDRPGAREAWAGVRVLEGAVDASIRLTDVDFRGGGDRRTLSDALTPGVRPTGRFEVFAAWEGFRGCAPDGQSAYAFVNPSRERPATVRLRFFEHTDAGADVLHEAQLEIAPLGRRAAVLGGLFRDLFAPDASTQFCSEARVRGAGLIDVTSDVPLAVEALHLNLRSGHFYKLPVTALEPADEAP